MQQHAQLSAQTFQMQQGFFFCTLIITIYVMESKCEPGDVSLAASTPAPGPAPCTQAASSATRAGTYDNVEKEQVL